MVQITVTDDLAQAIAKAGPLVTLVDSRGCAIGQITPLESKATAPLGMTAEYWDEVQRRMREPGEYVTFQEIRDRLGW